jgi:hypothetical protein
MFARVGNFSFAQIDQVARRITPVPQPVKKAGIFHCRSPGEPCHFAVTGKTRLVPAAFRPRRIFRVDPAEFIFKPFRARRRIGWINRSNVKAVGGDDDLIVASSTP